MKRMETRDRRVVVRRAWHITDHPSPARSGSRRTKWRVGGRWPAAGPAAAAAELRREATLLLDLDAPFALPRTVPTNGGAAFAEHDGWVWRLQEGVPGRPIQDAAIVLWRTIGE